MKKIALFTLLTLMLATPLLAQIDHDFTIDTDFQRFRDSIFNDFETFRRQANEEYANFMRRPWVEEPIQPAETPPVQPKPTVPVVVNPKARPTADPIPFNGKPIKPKPIDNPTPLEPIKLTPRLTDPVSTVNFFGTSMAFHFNYAKLPRLANAYENSVAQMWSELSDSYFDNLIAECLQYRESNNLCDWAYVMLTKDVAEKCYGVGTNESVVLHQYLLTQSGFNVRMARATNDKLMVMIGSTAKIYNYQFFYINDLRYYIVDRELSQLRFYVYNQPFPKEKTLSLVPKQPKLSFAPSKERTIKAENYFDLKATVEVNQNLIDFYNTYPLNSEWHTYAEASLSKNVKDDLYPVLRAAIKDKTEVQAANMLINFVQTGFKYQKDDVQFGYERPLFPDESLYYPYCDCEDRSILYACLINELLGMDIVLLYYPGHLATAVRFSGDVQGDYLMIEGQKYIICDPTYIHANIGICMPDYKKTAPIVQQINWAN